MFSSKDLLIQCERDIYNYNASRSIDTPCESSGVVVNTDSASESLTVQQTLNSLNDADLESISSCELDFALLDSDSESSSADQTEIRAKAKLETQRLDDSTSKTKSGSPNLSEMDLIFHVPQMETEELMSSSIF